MKIPWKLEECNDLKSEIDEKEKAAKENDDDGITEKRKKTLRTVIGPGVVEVLFSKLLSTTRQDTMQLC